MSDSIRLRPDHAPLPRSNVPRDKPTTKRAIKRANYPNHYLNHYPYH